MDRSQIIAIIQAAAARQGVDPATLLRIGEIESSLNPNDRATRSSASGLFQLTRAGWQDYGQGDPLDPTANADAGARMTAANIAGLKASGYPINPQNTYLAHFAGLGGARSLLGADPSAPVASVLSPEAIKANPEVLGRGQTVGDVINWAGRRMAGGGTQSLAGGPSPQPANRQEAPVPSLTLDQLAMGLPGQGTMPVAPGNAAPLDLAAAGQPANGGPTGMLSALFGTGNGKPGLLGGAAGMGQQQPQFRPPEPMAMPVPVGMRNPLLAAILQRGSAV